MPVLVTGGTGYLGSAVVRALSQKYAVRLLVRDTRGTGFFQKLPRVSFVVGDVRDRSSLLSAVKGCEAVFHLAALVKSWVREPAFFEAVNVEGFRNVAEASWKEGVRRLIYTSSFLALGPTEEAPAKPLFQNSYELSKKQALLLAREYQKRGHPLVTAIPTVLYREGARTEGNHLSRILERLTKRRFPGWIDGGRWRWNFAYVEDVAAAYPLLFENGKNGEEYVLGGETVTLREFFTLAAEIAAVSLPDRELSPSLLLFYAAFQEFLATLFAFDPPLTRGILETYRHDWAPRDDKARRELGYGTTPLRTAISKTIGWLKTS